MQVETSLEAQGMTPEEVAEYREKNWTYFLRNCRRLVPERERLLKRFNSVIEQFWDVIDATSGEILLGPKALEAVNLLRRHIEADCLTTLTASRCTIQEGKMQPGSLLAAVSEGPTAQRFGLCILRYLILTARYNSLQVSRWLLIAARCSHCMPSNTRFHLLQRWCNVLGCLLNLTVGSCVADVIFMDLT